MQKMSSVKSDRIKIDDSYMNYITFGNGSRNLIFILGLNVGGTKNSKFMLANMYSIFSEEYSVYIFDRKNDICDNYSVYDMAEDIYKATKIIGIDKADILGISHGGMIAQALVIKYPEIVRKLVLAMTLSRQNKTIRSVIENWIKYASGNDHNSIEKEAFSLMYSDEYLNKYGSKQIISDKNTNSSDLKKFEIIARSCLDLDLYDKLDKIVCPVFVIGGKKDKIVSGKASEEIAEKIGCEIYMYDDLGHAAYEEAPDFFKRVYDFLIS